MKKISTTLSIILLLILHFGLICFFIVVNNALMESKVETDLFGFIIINLMISGMYFMTWYGLIYLVIAYCKSESKKSKYFLDKLDSAYKIGYRDAIIDVQKAAYKFRSERKSYGVNVKTKEL